MNFNSGSSLHDTDCSKITDNLDFINRMGRSRKVIAQIADEFSYTYSSARNCLTIVKYFQPVLPKYSTQPSSLERSSDVLNIFNGLKKYRTNQSDRSSNQPMQKITLQLNNDIATVTQVLGWVKQLDHLPIPESVLQFCKLAAMEGFMHAVHHHKSMPSNIPIELEIGVFNDRLEMKMWDWGKPFDCKKKSNEKLQE
jgi:serine/threonine-protein kinase RsbW